jgi:hypothetical protein
MNMHKLFISLAALGSTLTTASAYPQIVNGGFEDPQTYFRILYTGESIPGWTVLAGTIDLCGAGIWLPAEGNTSVDMVGTPSRGALAQNVTFDAADDHYLSFQLSRNWNINYSVVKLGVWYKPPSAAEFLGLGLYEYDNINSRDNMMWQQTGTGAFTAEPGVTTFLFVALSGADTPGTSSWGGAALDDVRLLPGDSPYDPLTPPDFSSVAAIMDHYGLAQEGPLPVPDGGLTAGLLGFVLTGLAGLRRRS